MSQRSSIEPVPRRLWWLPLAAGLLPVSATLIAYPLSVHLGLVPGCNPFLEGCVSISRAARHELPNQLFRALMMPAAVLQAACWLLIPAWFASIAAPSDRWQRVLPWLGAAAALFLMLYVAFLGAEGQWARWMRRYGVVFYFGFTTIGMLIVCGRMQRSTRAVPRRVSHALAALCAALPLLGLAHLLVPLALPGDAARHALENATEWWAGAIFTGWFCVLAWAWRATGFAASLISRA